MPAKRKSRQSKQVVMEDLHLEDLSSFTPLHTIHLPSPHVLHPAACNPTMDLVVLISGETALNQAISMPYPPGLLGPDEVPRGATDKGKGKEAALRGKVSVWRMMGSRVWEVDVEGVVAGIAWSRDGLYLSILLLNKDNSRSLQHRSVHNGELTKTVNIEAPASQYHSGGSGGWWKMEWQEATAAWENPKNGSTAMIIDSLPLPTPVEPPQPLVLNPFAKPLPKTPPGPHQALKSFPSLLSPSTLSSSSSSSTSTGNPPIPPDILIIKSPGSEPIYQYNLLTGTYHLSGHIRPKNEILRFTQSVDKIYNYLDLVLKGIESCHHSWREGEKQNVIWREELETCADQQGISHEEVHADLFKFLMTGRSGNAVTEWLGNRLTGRTITKWETTLDTSFKSIQKVLGESVIPALQRIILLLEEMSGWSKSLELEGNKKNSDLKLHSNKIKRLLDVVSGFILLAEQIRQDSVHEALAGQEWTEWLKYEIAKAAAGETDAPPIATYDLKLVWSFMQNGFRCSIFKTYFPDLPDRPPKDLLPIDIKLGDITQSNTSIDQAIEKALQKLQGHSRSRDPEILSPDIHDISLNTSTSMSIESISADDIHPDPDESVIEPRGRAESPDDDDRSIITTKPADHSGDSIPRKMELEPWCWVNTLVAEMLRFVKEGIKEDRVERLASRMGPDGMMMDEEGMSDDEGDDGVTVEDEDIMEEARLRKYTRDPGDGVFDSRRVGDEIWYAWIADFNSQAVVMANEQTMLYLHLSPAHCLTLQFFDDTELVLLLQDTNGIRYLASIDYGALKEKMIDLERHNELPDEWHMLVVLNEFELYEGIMDGKCTPQLLKCRRLGDYSTVVGGETVSLALNGRQGRRVGCVMMGEGREIAVFDMDADEGEEEQEDADESMEVE